MRGAGSGAKPPSINAPCAIPAMPSASVAANTSKKCSAGSRRTGGVAQVKVRGLPKVQAVFIFAIAAYNLVRIPKLLQPT